MKYDHDLYDSCMNILRFAHKRLLEKGDGITASYFSDAIQWNERAFFLNINEFIKLVPLALKNWKVVLDTNPIDLSLAEKEASLAAVEGRGPRATNTQEALAAVKAAHKRLAKAERMRPFTEKQRAADEAKRVVDEKKRVLDEQKQLQARPGEELSAAEKILRQAEDEAKKVGVEVGK